MFNAHETALNVNSASTDCENKEAPSERKL